MLSLIFFLTIAFLFGLFIKKFLLPLIKRTYYDFKNLGHSLYQDKKFVLISIIIYFLFISAVILMNTNLDQVFDKPFKVFIGK